MDEFVWEFDDEELQKQLKAIADRIRKKKLLRLIGSIVRESVKENFSAGGRPDRWKPSRRGQADSVPGTNGATLRDTGRLMNSITSKVQGDKVLVGTNVEYAATHHFGATKGSFGEVLAQVKSHERIRDGKTITVRAHTRKMQLPWGDIPARPFLLVQDEDVIEIEALSAQYIIEGESDGRVQGV